MTANNFDELTKDLACSTSRRQALKAIFAGTVGSALGFISLGTAQAAVCVPTGRPYPQSLCKKDSDCCSHNCVYTSVGGDYFCFCGSRCQHDSDCCHGHCSKGYCK